jgi:hypothetical protein
LVRLPSIEKNVVAGVLTKGLQAIVTKREISSFLLAIDNPNITGIVVMGRAI